MSTTEKSGLARVEDSYPENRGETHSVQICGHTNDHSSLEESLFYFLFIKIENLCLGEGLSII